MINYFKEYISMTGSDAEIASDFTKLLYKKRKSIFLISINAATVHITNLTETVNEVKLDLDLYYIDGKIQRILIYPEDYREHDIIFYIDWIYNIINKIFPEFSFSISEESYLKCYDTLVSFLFYNIDHVMEYDRIEFNELFGFIRPAETRITFNITRKDSENSIAMIVWPHKVTEDYKIHKCGSLTDCYLEIPKCYFKHNDSLNDLENLEMIKLKRRLEDANSDEKP